MFSADPPSYREENGFSQVKRDEVSPARRLLQRPGQSPWGLGPGGGLRVHRRACPQVGLCRHYMIDRKRFRTRSLGLQCGQGAQGAWLFWSPNNVSGRPRLESQGLGVGGWIAALLDGTCSHLLWVLTSFPALANLESCCRVSGGILSLHLQFCPAGWELGD